MANLIHPFMSFNVHCNVEDFLIYIIFSTLLHGISQEHTVLHFLNRVKSVFWDFFTLHTPSPSETQFVTLQARNKPRRSPPPSETQSNTLRARSETTKREPTPESHPLRRDYTPNPLEVPCSEYERVSDGSFRAGPQKLPSTVNAHRRGPDFSLFDRPDYTSYDYSQPSSPSPPLTTQPKPGYNPASPKAAGSTLRSWSSPTSTPLSAAPREHPIPSPTVSASKSAQRSSVGKSSGSTTRGSSSPSSSDSGAVQLKRFDLTAPLEPCAVQEFIEDNRELGVAFSIAMAGHFNPTLRDIDFPYVGRRFFSVLSWIEKLPGNFPVEDLDLRRTWFTPESGASTLIVSVYVEQAKKNDRHDEKVFRHSISFVQALLPRLLCQPDVDVKINVARTHFSQALLPSVGQLSFPHCTTERFALESPACYFNTILTAAPREWFAKVTELRLALSGGQLSTLITILESFSSLRVFEFEDVEETGDVNLRMIPKRTKPLKIPCKRLCAKSHVAFWELLRVLDGQSEDLHLDFQSAEDLRLASLRLSIPKESNYLMGMHVSVPNEKATAFISAVRSSGWLTSSVQKHMYTLIVFAGSIREK